MFVLVFETAKLHEFDLYLSRLCLRQHEGRYGECQHPQANCCEISDNGT